MKKCFTCKTEKPFSDFSKDAQKKDGRNSSCRVCRSLSRKSLRLNNIEHERKRDNDRWLKRKKKKIEYDKRRYAAKKNQINQQLKTRYETDINFKLSLNIRRRMVKFIKNKKSGTVESLGCPLIEFKSFIESKFMPNMSWDNYGEWHLDHIYPLSKVNLQDPAEFAAACHYSNYQPLWAKDNISKRDKVSEEAKRIFMGMIEKMKK